ncbi:hypothetical protein EIN_389870 [Entamoeba invadens IP1]|uniref:TLDc domain-containing protein n=1 Tax=Entamoeba invadens IP1 TaxID=370355 RepID=A0A0A1U598_ENTIV|nr:hypothetical protein EIN_389870 [Entamoeba invadens IP1]ELP89402.1 hypothetical protein EIN_389870 [Entamoeba invadens IP1]|eukprot:XP_004256173.1 hypothetical protein EIN_389870 [Entamoeba invadens IP1]
MPSKKEELYDQLSQLKNKVTQIETNLSLISSRVIHNEITQKDLQKQISDITIHMTNIPPYDELIAQKTFEPFTDDLKKFTEKEKYEVVYDSIKDGFTSHTINNVIQNKNNVMIVVETNNGNVFGSFSSAVIPNSEKTGYGFYVTKDPGFFLFCLAGKSVLKPKKYTKKDTMYSLKMYSDDNEEFVVGSHCGFYVGATRNSFISNKMPLFYNGIDNVDEIVGMHFPNTFTVSRVCALVWS